MDSPNNDIYVALSLIDTKYRCKNKKYEIIRDLLLDQHEELLHTQESLLVV